MNHSFKYLTPISVFFVTVLIISNIVSAKMTTIGPFTFDGGTILFPLSYIFGDVITEVYGYKRARKVIYLGFFALLFSAATIMIVGALPPAADRTFQESYNNVLWWTPRIVIASLIAYFIWEFVNSYIMAKMKIISKGKNLAARTISSTIFGQFFDTIIFVLIAFYGVFPNEMILAVIISNYIFKVWIEILFTPITVATVNKIKKEENVDTYDKETNFNPFKF